MFILEVISYTRVWQKEKNKTHLVYNYHVYKWASKEMLKTEL